MGTASAGVTSSAGHGYRLRRLGLCPPMEKPKEPSCNSYIRPQICSLVKQFSGVIDSMQQFFIGLGVPKAGTSWLHAQLKSHPEVWVPPLKELHYWDLPHLPNAGFYRSQRQVRLGHVIDRGADAEVIDWHRRHAEGCESIDWYRSLFTPRAEHRACGEITPNYASLPYEDLVAMRDEFPSMKAFCVIRDPVDRVVSAIKFKITRGQQDLQSALRDPKHFAEAAQLPGGISLSRYEGVLPKLHSVFGDSLHVLFYEDLFSEDGQDVMDALYSFLGISPKAANLRAKANASKPLDVSFDPRSVIGKELLPAYAATEAFMGRLPESWAA